jgi:hypothetical protein
MSWIKPNPAERSAKLDVAPELYDKRITIATDGQVAAYAVPETSRRQFLSILGGTMAYAALGGACGGGGGGGNPATPGKTYNVRISLFDTFTKAPISEFNYNVGTGDKVSKNGQINETVNGGQYTWRFWGNGIRIMRECKNIALESDIDASVLAIGNGTDVDVNCYRQICMGVGAPYPTGGAQQYGSSVRLRNGVNPHIIITKASGIEDTYYRAFDTARSVFSEFTGGIFVNGGQAVSGIVTSDGIEYVDTKPTSNIPEGAVLVTFSNAGFLTSVDRDKNNYVTASHINAPNGKVGSPDGIIQTIKHEYGHTLVLDHSSDVTALMSPDFDHGSKSAPTDKEISTCCLKYNRKAGHTLDATTDSD